MSNLRVIKYGNPILRMKASKVVSIDDNLHQLVKDMIEIMREDKGIGLAAPQVAQSLALLVIEMDLIKEGSEPDVFLNPEILSSEGESVLEEGCLSLPDIREEVVRPEIITIRYQNLEGEIIEKKIDGLLARVLQHEIDHLNGVLFIDRLSSLKKQMLKKQLKQIAADEKKMMSKAA